MFHVLLFVAKKHRLSCRNPTSDVGKGCVVYGDPRCRGPLSLRIHGFVYVKVLANATIVSCR